MHQTLQPQPVEWNIAAVCFDERLRFGGDAEDVRLRRNRNRDTE